MITPRDIAKLAHGDQRYGGRPYIYHIDMVVDFVDRMYGESPKHKSLRKVAFAHDILEDTTYTSESLRVFGYTEPEVLAVEAITKGVGEPYEEYMARVLRNKLARKVKIADTMANLQESMKERQTKRIDKYTKQLRILHGL